MRGIGVYIIIVFAVICIWYWLSAGATSNSYTQSQFEKDLDKNQVKSVKVVQNREIPTGSLEVKFKDGTSKVLYVSDVNNIEKTMTKAGYTDYTVADVPAESWIMTLLPYLLVFGAMFILFAVMNSTGRRWQDDELRQEPCEAHYTGGEPYQVFRCSRPKGGKGGDCRDR